MRWLGSAAPRPRQCRPAPDCTRNERTLPEGPRRSLLAGRPVATTVLGRGLSPLTGVAMLSLDPAPIFPHSDDHDDAPPVLLDEHRLCTRRVDHQAESVLCL